MTVHFENDCLTPEWETLIEQKSMEGRKLVPEKERDFKCKLCDKCFVKEDSLKRHVKKVHEEEENCAMIFL